MNRTQTLAHIIGIEPNRRLSALQIAYMRASGDKAMGPTPLALLRSAPAALRLPAGEDGGVLSRPQRRGGARGVYGVRVAS